MNLEDIVDSATIARRLGVSCAAVCNWGRRLESFPKPLEAPGVGTPLRLWSEVKAWHENRVDPRLSTKKAPHAMNTGHGVDCRCSECHTARRKIVKGRITE